MSSIVAVTGLEPATSPYLTLISLSAGCALPTELHGTIYIERLHRKLLEATPARNPAALLGLHQSFVSSVKYPHSCGSFGFHSLPLFPRPYTTTFLPYCYVSGPTRGHCRGRNLPRFFWLYLRVSIPSLSTPSALRSLSLPF